MADNNESFNIVLGLDYSDLERGLKRVKDNISATTKALSEVDKQLKLNPNNVELWRKKQRLLNEQINDTKKKLTLQQQTLKLLLKDYNGTDKAKTKIENLKTQINSTTNSLKKLNSQADTTNLKLKSLTSFDPEKLKKLGSSLTKHITLPLVSAATALGTLAMKTSNTVDSLGDSANAVNANVEAYQELIYAAKLTGANEDALQRTLVKVNAMLGDIASGDSLTAAQNLHKIGLSIDDIKGKSSDEAFMKIRDALSKIEDESLRVAYANEIFGDKLGSELLPLLKAEDSQIESLRNEARKYGIATEEQVEANGKFHDELDRLKQALFGVSLELMEELLPSLTNLVDYIKDEVVPKIKSMKEGWDNLNPSTKKTIKQITLVVASIGPLVSIIGTAVGAVTNFKKGFNALKTAVVSLTKIGLSPIQLGIAALVAVLVSALASNEDFRESVKNLFKALSPLIEGIGDLAGALVDLVVPIIEPLVDLIKDIVEAITPIVEFIADLVGKHLKVLADLIKKVSDVLKPVLDFIGKLIGDTIKLGLEGFNRIFETIRDVFKQVYEIVKDKLGPIFDWFKGIIDKVKEATSDLIDKLKSAIEKMKEYFQIGKNDAEGAYKDVFGQDKPWLGVGGKFEGAFRPQSARSSIVNNNVSVFTSSNTLDINTLNAALGGSYL